MKKKMFTDAIAQDHLVALFRDTLQFRSEMKPLDLQILNESIRDYLARNAGPLDALLSNPAFIELYPPLVCELLVRAHALAPGPCERKWIEDQAVKLNFGELFGRVQAPASPLTRSQAKALKQLHALATLHFRGGRTVCDYGRQAS